MQVATRSRTEVFRRHRDGCRSHRKLPPSRNIELSPWRNDPKNQKALLDIQSDDGQTPGMEEISTGVPKWVPLVDELNHNLAVIRRKMTEMQDAQGKRLLPGFGDEEEDNEELVQNLCSDVTMLFKECERALKTIGDNSLLSESSKSDEACRKNVQTAIALQLQELSLEFRRSQKQYLKKLQGQKGQEFVIDIPSPSSGIPIMSSMDDDVGGYGFNAEQQFAVDEMDLNVTARSQQIDQIAGSIGELATMFKELQVLVIDQGTILDRIDYNIEQSGTRVTSALEELKKADKYHRRSRTMLCIYLLLLLCVGMAVVLVLKKTAFKHSDSKP